MPSSFVYMSHFAFELFYGPKILLTLLLPLEKDTNGHTSTCVKVFSLIVTFLNEIGMGGCGSKMLLKVFGTEKKFKDKMGHTYKTREYLCTLSQGLLTQAGLICIFSLWLKLAP